MAVHDAPSWRVRLRPAAGRNFRASTRLRAGPAAFGSIARHRDVVSMAGSSRRRCSRPRLRILATAVQSDGRRFHRAPARDHRTPRTTLAAGLMVDTSIARTHGTNGRRRLRRYLANFDVIHRYAVTNSIPGNHVRYRPTSRLSSAHPTTAAWAPIKKSGNTPLRVPPAARYL